MPKINPFQVIGCWNISESGGKNIKNHIVFSPNYLYIYLDYLGMQKTKFLFVLSHYIACTFMIFVFATL